MTLARTELVTRHPHRLSPDPARVIAQLFVPGQEGFEVQESRAGLVLSRILALTDAQVALLGIGEMPAHELAELHAAVMGAAHPLQGVQL